jgi:hypothetical protein
MTINQILLIASALVIALLVFLLLRKTHISFNGKKWIRIILFGCMISYLAFDFYTKQKYALLVVLALGSVAFVYMVLRAKE